jgi:hypothetical protein
MLKIWLASNFRKLGTSTSGTSCILHNNRELGNNSLVYKCYILHKITVRCIKKFASCRIPYFSPAGIRVYFIPSGKIKSDSLENIRTAANPICSAQ